VGVFACCVRTGFLVAEVIANDSPLPGVRIRASFVRPQFVQDVPEEPLTLFAHHCDYRDPFIADEIHANAGCCGPHPLHYNTINYIWNVPSPGAAQRRKLLGTDESGPRRWPQSYLRLSHFVLFGLILTLASCVCRRYVGALQGFHGGKWTLSASVFIESGPAFPVSILLIYSVLALCSHHFWWSAGHYACCVSWMGWLDVVRAEFFAARVIFEYVKSGKGQLGLDNRKIMFRPP